MASRSGPSSSSRRPSTGRRDERSAVRGSGKAEPTKLTSTESRSSSSLTGRAIVMIVVVGLLLASYTTTMTSWWQQRNEIRALEAQNAQARDDIAALEAEKLRWDDPAYATAQARQRFGWVMPGEVGYRVIGLDGQVQGESAQLQAPPISEDSQWHEKLWDTIQLTDQTPVEQPETPERTDDTILENE